MSAASRRRCGEQSAHGARCVRGYTGSPGTPARDGCRGDDAAAPGAPPSQRCRDRSPRSCSAWGTTAISRRVSRHAGLAAALATASPAATVVPGLAPVEPRPAQPDARHVTRHGPARPARHRTLETCDAAAGIRQAARWKCPFARCLNNAAPHWRSTMPPEREATGAARTALARSVSNCCDASPPRRSISLPPKQKSRPSCWPSPRGCWANH